jgi:hypothetical protein
MGVRRPFTITIYSFLYYMGMNAHSMFFKCAHFFHDSWQVSQDKKRKKSLQVFMLHKKPSAIGFTGIRKGLLSAPDLILVDPMASSFDDPYTK